MRLALAQLRPTADRAESLERALDAMRRAARSGAEVVVFPELAVEPFFPRCRRPEGGPRSGARAGAPGTNPVSEPIPGPTTDRVAALARELSLVTVFNLYERDAQGRTFDSSPVIDADGALLGVTRMVHITDYEGFHEQDYYDPGDCGAPVYATRACRLGVAICYDRHYPEYMRALGVACADVVAIPQAGTLGEWPEGLYEAEVRTAAFQNGYFAALANRVGEEGELTFAGESFVCDPEGVVLARGARLEEDLVVTDLDLGKAARSTARRLFWRDRRPELYERWLGRDEG